MGAGETSCEKIRKKVLPVELFSCFVLPSFV